MSYRTTDQTAENITCACVCRYELGSVTDEHDGGTCVVGEDTHGACHLLVRIVLLSGNFLDIGDDRCEQVDLIYITGTVEESEDPL